MGGGGGAGQDAFAGVSFHVEAQARFFLCHLMPCAS